MVLGAIATGYGLWNAFRRNTKLGAGISNKVGNWIQEKMKVKDSDSGFTKLLKGAGDALNKEVFDPDNVTSEDKAPSL